MPQFDLIRKWVWLIDWLIDWLIVWAPL
jgi:hypothetical protein